MRVGGPELQAGRWHIADHITIGEARAVTKCFEVVCQDPDAHNHVFLWLCKTTTLVQAR